MLDRFKRRFSTSKTRDSAKTTFDCCCISFPLKRIHEVGTFQDPGSLENNPLVSALSEVAATFPLIKEPDFVVSLGTGESKLENEDFLTADSHNI
jgi:hypothetical protein